MQHNSMKSALHTSHYQQLLLLLLKHHYIYGSKQFCSAILFYRFWSSCVIWQAMPNANNNGLRISDHRCTLHRYNAQVLAYALFVSLFVFAKRIRFERSHANKRNCFGSTLRTSYSLSEQEDNVSLNWMLVVIEFIECAGGATASFDRSHTKINDKFTMTYAYYMSRSRDTFCILILRIK